MGTGRSIEDINAIGRVVSRHEQIVADNGRADAELMTLDWIGVVQCMPEFADGAVERVCATHERHVVHRRVASPDQNRPAGNAQRVAKRGANNPVGIANRQQHIPRRGRTPLRTAHNSDHYRNQLPRTYRIPPIQPIHGPGPQGALVNSDLRHAPFNMFIPAARVKFVSRLHGVKRRTEISWFPCEALRRTAQNEPPRELSPPRRHWHSVSLLRTRARRLLNSASPRACQSLSPD